ncbi:hypothetical protein bpmyx0001_55700 [Bacillus pseudomycoides DSM 12442]|nr:hypothetical protein bpmyx0001_55700 [Bacillus pseudomycoides DSM 12442]
MEMIENPMLIGNPHDSSVNDSIGNCEGCSQEIYFGEEYLDFEGDFIHNSTECVEEYVVGHSLKKVAGE